MGRLRTAALALGLALAMSLPAFAQMGGRGMGGMAGGGMPGMEGGPAKCPLEKGPMWLSTLSTEQRAKMDAMHLALRKEMSVLEAEVGLREAELKNLITRETPDKKAVSQKIDEIIGLKKEMMTKKYDHVMELRGILTPEQRTSFDMMFLGGMGHMGRWMEHGGRMEHGMGGMEHGMGGRWR